MRCVDREASVKVLMADRDSAELVGLGERRGIQGEVYQPGVGELRCFRSKIQVDVARGAGDPPGGGLEGHGEVDCFVAGSGR